MAKSKYRFIGGEHFENGKALVPGDVLELDEVRAYNLRDRFVSVNRQATEAPSVPARTQPPVPPAATTVAVDEDEMLKAAGKSQ